MKERPILFSAPMVRAILDGSKTQTRRVVKLQTPKAASISDFCVDGIRVGRCPYGQPGDRLWVREAWADCDKLVRYYATDDVHPLRKKRPSIHMPRWASRITLEVTGVRVERLQDISEGDCIDEGIGQVVQERLPKFEVRGEYDAIDIEPVEEYRDLWESINGPDSWGANPWVWVVKFKVNPP